MDKVFINQLQVNAIIGVYDHEKEVKQPLFFDLEMWTDFGQAAATDDVKYVVDYAKVSARIIEHTQAQPVELLETLAEQLSTIIFNEFPVYQLRLRINKPHAVLEAQSVGIEIERTAN